MLEFFKVKQFGGKTVPNLDFRAGTNLKEDIDDNRDTERCIKPVTKLMIAKKYKLFGPDFAWQILFENGFFLSYFFLTTESFRS